MARSHTGHLTGSDDVISAAFRQYGITRVDGLDELQDTSMMLARAQPPGGNGVCIYAISGGTGAHMADMAAAAGLRLPDLTPETQRELHEWIPSYLRVSNPVDNGGAPSADERGRKILDAIVADPNVDLVICPITGALASLSMPLARDLVAVGETTHKPICVIWGSPLGSEEAYRDVLLPSRLPVFRTFGNCVGAVRAYFDHHSFLGRYRSPWERPPVRRSPSAARAADRLEAAGGQALTEAEAKELLADYGIPVTREEVVTSPAEAARAASSIGYPVVMKISSADIEHKSDLGLVAVGVASPTEVRRTYSELRARAAQAAPAAHVDGVLVAEMITDGTECVVGIAHDDLFGPVVMFGLGGVLVEVLGDVTFRVPPFDRAEARRMIDEVAGSALLRGVRGRPPGDVSALADTLVRVQRLALDLSSHLAELDINPLIVRPKGHGVIALDALAVPR
jgi:acyl-CoA synthetase (NDP forming)